MVDLSAIVSDLADAPSRFLDALNAVRYRKGTLASNLTAEELRFAVAEVTQVHPGDLSATSFHSAGLRSIVHSGAVMGVDQMTMHVQGVKISIVSRAVGYPGRQVNFRIGTEQAGTLTWLYNEGILDLNGAPYVVTHDCASANESDSFFLACSFQGSIPVACRHPAENTSEDTNRRTKDLQPADLRLDELPAHLVDSAAELPLLNPSKLCLMPRTPLHLYMAGYAFFQRLQVKPGHVVSLLGIEVRVRSDVELGSWVVAGIRPDDMRAVGRQPCTVDVFDFDLDLPRAEDGRLWLGRGITRYESLGQTRALWTPGQGLEPETTLYMSGSLPTGMVDRLKWDLSMYQQRFGIRVARVVSASPGEIDPSNGLGEQEAPAAAQPAGKSDPATHPVTGADPVTTNTPDKDAVSSDSESEVIQGNAGATPSGQLDVPGASLDEPKAPIVDDGVDPLGVTAHPADADGGSDGAEGFDLEVPPVPSTGEGLPEADGSDVGPQPVQPEDKPEVGGSAAHPGDPMGSKEPGPNRHEPVVGGANEDIGDPSGHVPNAPASQNPIVRPFRRRGQIAVFPGSTGEDLLLRGGNDPAAVSDWLENCPFAPGRERWMGQPVLESLSVARGPFRRSRPARVEEDVPGFDPCLDDLLAALISLSLAVKAPDARTKVHWCMDAISEVETHGSVDEASILALREDLERALIDATSTHTGKGAAKIAKRWVRAFKRAMR